MRTHGRLIAFASLALLAALAPACTLQNQELPALMGPSGHALSVELAASPDYVLRDGASSSVVTVTVRDHEGKAVAGQRLRLSAAASPSAGGTLTASEITTGTNGQASFRFIAPELSEDVSEVTVGATPVGTNAAESLTRLVRINVIGPSVPVPSFTYTPAAPVQFQQVAFDASGTTVGGVACTSGCTFAWTFGTEGTGTGSLVQYRFQGLGVHAVTLTVTSAAGAKASVTRTVSVGAAPKPTAAFLVSPTNPLIDETVYVNGGTSAVAAGSSAQIAKYIWDFGNGASAESSSPTASVTYGAARTFVITLIVEDSNGVRSTGVSQTVTVTAPTP